MRFKKTIFILFIAWALSAFASFYYQAVDKNSLIASVFYSLAFYLLASLGMALILDFCWKKRSTKKGINWLYAWIFGAFVYLLLFKSLLAPLAKFNSTIAAGLSGLYVKFGFPVENLWASAIAMALSHIFQWTLFALVPMSLGCISALIFIGLLEKFIYR